MARAVLVSESGVPFRSVGDSDLDVKGYYRFVKSFDGKPEGIVYDSGSTLM